MRAALADHQLLDGRAAAAARLSIASVDLELGLVRARIALGRAVERVKGTALALDRLGQHALDDECKLLRLLQRHARAVGQRVQADCVQRLIHIDVAKPGQEGLIEQQRLHGAPPRLQRRVQPRAVKSTGQRLRAEVGKLGDGRRARQHATELAHIQEPQRVAIVQVQPDLPPRRSCLACGLHHQTPRHAQVHQHVPRCARRALQVQHDPFGAPPRLCNALPLHGARKELDVALDGARPSALHALDGAAHHKRAHQTHRRFYLRQLGHARIMRAHPASDRGALPVPPSPA